MVSHDATQRIGVPALPNLRVPFHLCIHPLSDNYQIWLGNIKGEGACFRGQPRPNLKGRAPALPNFGRSLLCMRTPFVAQLPNLTWYHTSGRGAYLGVNHASHPKTAEFQRSRMFGVLLHLCLHTLTQNVQIPHGNQYREGRVFMRSAMPLRWHKCVARFLSDSWVSC